MFVINRVSLPFYFELISSTYISSSSSNYNLEPSFSQGTQKRGPRALVLSVILAFFSLCTNANGILSIYKKLLLTVIFYDFDHITFVSMSFPKEWMLWEVVNGESQLPLTCVTRE